MAVAINSQEASNVAHGSITSSPLTWSFTNSAGTLLIVAAECSDQSNTVGISAPTYGGVTMTLVPSSLITWDTNKAATALYYLLNPATGANTVSCGFTGVTGANRGMLGSAISFTGNHATTPVGTATTATGSGTAVSRTVTGTTNGNIVVNSVGCGSATGTATSPTTLSARLNQNALTGGNNHALGQQATSGGTVTAAWTVTSDVWGISAVEILAAAAGDNFYGQVWL